jgi:hypothetical protein
MKILILLITLLAITSAGVGTDVFTICGEAPASYNNADVKFYG